jgi:transcriptional regulator with GAF, ATPase, and Fis domain
MSLPAQAKFLRVLQEREFSARWNQGLRTDARIVAATNRDLSKAIALARSARISLPAECVCDQPPPLRARPDDVLPLSEAFLAEFGAALGGRRPVSSRDARAMLMACEWPGNVAELRNILERAAIPLRWR